MVKFWFLKFGIASFFLKCFRFWQRRGVGKVILCRRNYFWLYSTLCRQYKVNIENDILSNQNITVLYAGTIVPSKPTCNTAAADKNKIFTQHVHQIISISKIFHWETTTSSYMHVTITICQDWSYVFDYFLRVKSYLSLAVCQARDGESHCYIISWIIKFLSS